MNPIDRIREYALSPAGRQRAAVAQAQPTAQANFESSRNPGRRPLPSGPATDFVDEPSALEMCRLVRPHGFVVRIDWAARSANKPGVKLFRFDDRSKPAKVCATFAGALSWLHDEAPVSSP